MRHRRSRPVPFSRLRHVNATTKDSSGPLSSLSPRPSPLSFSSRCPRGSFNSRCPPLRRIITVGRHLESAHQRGPGIRLTWRSSGPRAVSSRAVGRRSRGGNECVRRRPEARPPPPPPPSSSEVTNAPKDPSSNRLILRRTGHNGARDRPAPPFHSCGPSTMRRCPFPLWAHLLERTRKNAKECGAPRAGTASPTGTGGGHCAGPCETAALARPPT